ncbi:MAG: 8-oxo-dGDP phosphatase [Frankiaceae bacterium]|nr:8-oxo-dGDP phosphatase [Frankiaceae bacterium]
MTHAYDVVSSEVRYRGRVFTLRSDVVRMPGGATAVRDVVDHPGAVGIVAVDAALNVLLIRQYRHAVGTALWEVPAGLRDVPGEDPETTARRELHEETGWVAEAWTHLASAYATPGWSNERFEIYLARDLREAAERPEVHDEELDLELRWLPLAEACAWVLDGRITNALCAIGVLAAARRLGA